MSRQTSILLAGSLFRIPSLPLLGEDALGGEAQRLRVSVGFGGLKGELLQQGGSCQHRTYLPIPSHASANPYLSSSAQTA